jgi:hypothetical protein
MDILAAECFKVCAAQKIEVLTARRAQGTVPKRGPNARATMPDYAAPRCLAARVVVAMSLLVWVMTLFLSLVADSGFAGVAALLSGRVTARTVFWTVLCLGNTAVWICTGTALALAAGGRDARAAAAMAARAGNRVVPVGGDRGGPAAAKPPDIPDIPECAGVVVVQPNEERDVAIVSAAGAQKMAPTATPG